MNPALVKVREDIEEYRLLCIKYGEPVALKHGNPDIYGEHAKGLRRRLEDEAVAERQKAESEDWHRNMAIMTPMLYDSDTGEVIEDSAELEAAEEAAEKARRAERVKAQRAQKAIEKAAAVALEMKRQEAEKIRKAADRIKKARARAAHRAANPPTRFKRKDPI